MTLIYNNTISSCEESIALSDIARIESDYGIKFPEEIKNHYLHYNGGQLGKRNFGDYHVHDIASIEYGDLQLPDLFDPLILDNILPEGLVPFAVDEGGDNFCFSFREGEEGAIYIWCADGYDEDDLDAALTFITSSLTHLINGMTD